MEEGTKFCSFENTHDAHRNLLCVIIMIFFIFQKSMNVLWTRNVAQIRRAWMRSDITDVNVTRLISSRIQTLEDVKVGMNLDVDKCGYLCMCVFISLFVFFCVFFSYFFVLFPLKGHSK